MRKARLIAVLSAPLLALSAASVSLAQAQAPASVHPASVSSVRTGLAAGDPFCKRLGKKVLASSGAYMFCFGAHHPTTPQVKRPAVSEGPGAVSTNSDAASTSEDVNLAGVSAPGQSETAVAAIGPYVVEDWNDATGFLTSCPAPSSKEELTGVGFSSNGGKTFQDLGGLPNASCKKYVYEGDPGVSAYVAGGHDYFYISSLYDSATGIGPSKVAMDACEVTGSGTTATLSCGQPVIIGSSTQCQRFKISKTKFAEFCSFVDKDFITVDPANGRLYSTYTDFLIRSPFGTEEEMSVCDIGNPAGGPGPRGGRPLAPVCKTGSPLVSVGKGFLVGKPYFEVAKPDKRGCENEGSYPEVDTATGSVYVAYEYNLFTDQFAPCNGAATPTADVMTATPLSCLPVKFLAACKGPKARIAERIDSLNATPVAGYNRFGSNDFPRLAVSDHYGVVSMVWNDTRLHPLGDILLESFHLGSLTRVQAHPVVLDTPESGGMQMFPAVRTANAAGLLDVAWYSRSNPSTALTNVDAAIGVNPLTTTSPAANVRITTAASNWVNTASLITPNFGDYIDVNMSATGSPPYVGDTLYVAWSDGRQGVPQPYEANLPG